MLGGEERGDVPYPKISIPKPSCYYYHSIPGKLIIFSAMYSPVRMRSGQKGDLFLRVGNSRNTITFLNITLRLTTLPLDQASVPTPTYALILFLAVT